MSRNLFRSDSGHRLVLTFVTFFSARRFITALVGHINFIDTQLFSSKISRAEKCTAYHWTCPLPLSASVHNFWSPCLPIRAWEARVIQLTIMFAINIFMSPEILAMAAAIRLASNLVVQLRIVNSARVHSSYKFRYEYVKFKGRLTYAESPSLALLSYSDCVPTESQSPLLFVRCAALEWQLVVIFQCYAGV